MNWNNSPFTEKSSHSLNQEESAFLDSPENEDLNESLSSEKGLGTNAFYPNDYGQLPLDTRRVLVNLLAGPFIDGTRHSALWQTLVRDELVIRQRLSELFLDLALDKETQIAFTRKAETEDLNAPTLLRSITLSFLDSVLILQLRLMLTQADAKGDRATTSQEEIITSLSIYEDDENTDHAGFMNKINTAIEKMKKHKILLAIRGSENRYEISPTLKILFSADEIHALSEQYQQASKASLSNAEDSTNEESTL